MSRACLVALAIVAALLAPDPARAQFGTEPWEFATAEEWEQAQKELNPGGSRFWSKFREAFDKKKESEREARKLLNAIKANYEKAVAAIDRKANREEARRTLKWAIACRPESGWIETEKGSFDYYPYLHLARTYHQEHRDDLAERCLSREIPISAQRDKAIYDAITFEIGQARAIASSRRSVLEFARWAASPNSPLGEADRGKAADVARDVDELPAEKSDRSAIEGKVDSLRPLVARHMSGVHAKAEEFNKARWGQYMGQETATLFRECPREPAASVDRWRDELAACDRAVQGARAALVAKLCKAAADARLATTAWCAATPPAWPAWTALEDLQRRIEARIKPQPQPEPVSETPELPLPPSEPPAPAAWPVRALPALKGSFAALADGDVDRAIRDVRSALASGAFGRGNSAAALARASLAYFLSLKATAVGGKLQEQFEADARTQVDAALREDPLFRPREDLFPGSFVQTFAEQAAEAMPTR